MKSSHMKSPNTSIVTEGPINTTTGKNLIDHTNHHVPPQKGPLSNEKQRGNWTHNPAVLSLIACSTMHNCEEVREVYRECVANNDTDSMLCEAAEKYFKMCHIDKGDNSVLNYTPYVDL